MMMKKLALLGASHIHTPGFVDVLAARADVSVVAVWDPDPAIAEKYAARLQCRAAADVATVLGIPDLDAVIVLSQTNRHESLVRQIARANKHCFVEKPLGIGLADARKMMRALEAADVIFHTGYFNRTIPEHRLLKRLIAEAAFGEISRIRLAFGTPAAIDGIFHSDWLWMTDPLQAGVGAFGDLGTHKLDLLLFLMGDTARLEAVTATFSRPIRRYPQGEECGEAILRFDNGTIATLAASWVDLVEPSSLLISGSKGHAVMRNAPGKPHNDWGNELYLLSPGVDGATGREPWTDLPARLPRPLEQFIDAVVHGERSHLVSVREAAYSSYVMEVISQAAAERRWLPVDPGAL
jgi:predicted dehydrogenase